MFWPATGSRQLAIAFHLTLVTLVGGCSPSPTASDTSRQAAKSLPPILELGSQVTCWTASSPPCTGRGVLQVPDDISVLEGATQLAFGLRHGCLLDREGQVLCWGDALDGQLGVSAAEVPERHLGRPARGTPAPIPGAPRLESIDAGWLHTCGVATTGEVVCWGDNARGQLGRSDESSQARAVERIEGDTLAVALGGLHTCAVIAGVVRCWGDGSFGQLGDGEGSDSAVPVEVAGLPSAAIAVAAGGYHTCALLGDGSVWCWGDNRFGQLGDGTTDRQVTPVAVEGLLSPARSVVTGGSFSCALLTDGRVQCWGSDEMGELGDGERNGGSETPPRQLGAGLPVEGLASPVEQIAAGEVHACALAAGEGSEQELYCGGANDSGQLGDGSVTLRRTPVRFAALPADLAHSPIPAIEPPVEGLDVSYHSGRVDWSAAAAEGYRFGLMLATAGVDFRDPFLTAHWEHIRDAGLVRGAYHFYVAADDPKEQAHHFLSHVLLEPGDLRPVIDIESAKGLPPQDLADQLATFVDEIEATLGVQPIIYTGPTFWRDHVADARFANHPLWIAEYGVEEPRVPETWKQWHLWQWKGDAELPHVSPMVDLNRVHGGVDFESLRIAEHTE